MNGVIKGPWLPHVMFYVPEINPQALGSDQDDVPLDGHEDTVGRFTVLTFQSASGRMEHHRLLTAAVTEGA